MAFNTFLWLFAHANLVHNTFIVPNNVWPNPSDGKMSNVLVLAHTSPGVRSRFFGASGETCNGNKNH